MFTSLDPDLNLKRSAAFVASLCLQFLALVAVGSLALPSMSGPSIRTHTARSASVTPIYFHQDATATPTDPEPAPAVAHPTPEALANAKVASEQEATAKSDASDETSGDSDGQGLVPFASWSMSSKSAGFSIFHHQVNPALPVFTPDPPILHHEIPDVARGKEIVLEVVIDNQGSIVQATVLKGIGYGVESSIMETLRRWIFVPAKVNGMAIGSRRQLSFHFPA
jgi:TonB family protein